MRLGELAARVGGRVRGDPDREIEGVATLEAAGPAHLAFLTNARYRRSAEGSRAGAILRASRGRRLGRTCGRRIRVQVLRGPQL